MLKHAFKVIIALWVATLGVNGQVNITTWQNSLAHTGVNPKETILTPANVAAPGNFGLLFTQKLDGECYAQPLYVNGVTLADNSIHNIVYLATEHDGVYAFDADSATGKTANPLWYDSLLPAGTTTVSSTFLGSTDISPEIGITSTPVIDTTSQTIYVVTNVLTTSNSTCQQYLHALNLSTGAEKFGGPALISATFHGHGNTSATVGDGVVNGAFAFNPLRYNNRPALVLYNGVIYISYASHSDEQPYHGCILAYDATSLTPVKQFIATPNGTEGGIWQGGASPAVDSEGNLYFATGNGSFDQTKSTYTTDTDWSESFIKLPTTGTFDVSFSNPLNWFTPNIYATLTGKDLDLGSSGVLLLPDQAGPHPHLLVGGGKGGTLYVVDRDNMGGLNTTADNSVQEIPLNDSLFATPAYFNGYIYYAPSGGPLNQQAVGYDSVTGNYISTTGNKSTTIFTAKGAAPFISANVTSNGIVWILAAGTPSTLQAYNASNVSGSPIYSFTTQVPGSPVVKCTAAKFGIPMVANGKVYATGYDSTDKAHLFVLGLLAGATSAPAAPTNLVATASSSGQVTLNWTDNSNNESGFKVERATQASGPFTQIGLTGATIATYSDSGLSPQTTYYYEVLATNNVGDSAPTNIASATTFLPYTPAGLVAYWNFDEGTGLTANDVTGHGHTGTLTGEVSWLPGFIGNSALNFHGTGNALSNVTVADAPDLEFHSNGSFTLSAWVQPGGLRSADEAVIAKSRDQGNYYGIWINSKNQWVFRGPVSDLVGPTATANIWTHIAAVQDGVANKRYLYINGVLTATGPVQAANGTGALWIGQANGVEQPFPGSIDEVRLYDRALAANEITSLLGPPILDALSRQTQGSAGPFDLTLAPDSSLVVESRAGSTPGNYQLVLTFSSPVTGLAATLNLQPGQPGTAIGSVGSITYDPTHTIVAVNLTGVGNGQKLDVHLSNVQLTSGGATTTINGTADVPFDVLWGDVNGDGVVNNQDVQLIQNNFSSALNAGNSLDDINCDGMINATDAAFAQSPAPMQFNSGSLSSPWLDCDIGSVNQVGSASQSGGTFTVTGGGADIGETVDAFHYVYQPMVGDGTIVARVASLQALNTDVKAGIMIREALSPSSPEAMVNVNAAKGAQFEWRSTTAGNTLSTQSSGATLPYWIELIRKGNVFTAFVSSNGTNWVALGQAKTITMTSAVYVGLAVTSHNIDVPCTATFDNVQIGDVIFNPANFTNYNGQSAPSAVTVGNGGASVQMTGNFWEKYAYNYTLTPNSTLTFTVNSSNTGEILAIGMDNDNVSGNPAQLFQLGGTQTDTTDAVEVLSPVYTAGEGNVTYTIPIGAYYTGAMSYLTFVGQNNASDNTNVTFSNVEIEEKPPAYDVVVYEASPSGVMAAVEAASKGHSVALIEMYNHVGGMTSAGLDDGDFGDHESIGGLANEFFIMMQNYYTTTYGAGSPQAVACANGAHCEPHVAELLFDQMLAAEHVTVFKNLRLDLQQANSVTQDANGNITSLRLVDLVDGSLKTFTAKVYIDASYEGDLMAGAHVPYTYGREAQSEYGESLAGIRAPGPTFGQADDLIMSYCYRVTFCSNPVNLAPFPKPADYNPAPFGTTLAEIQNGTKTQFTQCFGGAAPVHELPNDKYDPNSFDFAGSSYGYADGDWSTRKTVALANQYFALSELYLLQDQTATVSPVFYQNAQGFGLPLDEFTDNGNFPFQIYVREARRMVGQYVLTQDDISQDRYKPDGICSGSYAVDCHIIQNVVVAGKTVVDKTPLVHYPAYDIPYGCLTPPNVAGQPGNLLVTVCISASHVAFCSVRIEPTYMMMGQAAGAAAHLAILNRLPVQQVNTTQLRSLLVSDGAVLDTTGAATGATGYVPPVKITWTPLQPQVGQVVTFTATTTGTPLSPLTNYWFDFEGTGAVSAQSSTAQYTFKLNKTYNVSLVVQDSAGRRKLATCQVPVGTATGQDLTVDDFDPSVTFTGTWESTQPTIGGFTDVFYGTSADFSVPGHGASTVNYQPATIPAGLYEVCYGYRPQSRLATTSPVVTIKSASGTQQVTLNQKTGNTSPFPFFALGQFRFNGDGTEYVEAANSDPTLTIETDGVRFVWIGN